MKGRRVLVIGLDGVSPSFVRHWANQGILPFLDDVRHRGASGILRSTVPPYTPTAWTSIVTGVNPGRHGIFGFTRRAADGSETIVDMDDRRSKALWEILDEQGIPSIIVNVPITFPIRPFGGVLVSGMGTPATATTIAHPDAVRQLIDREFPNYVPDVAVSHRARHSRRIARELVGQLSESTRTRLALTSRLLESHPWRFAMVVLEAPDRIQHLWWKRIAPGAPATKDREAVLDAYRQLDEGLGSLVSGARSDGPLDVLIVSDHGFQSLEWTLSMNNHLADLGLLSLRPLSPQMRIARALPPWARAAASRLRGDHQGTFRSLATDIDVRATVAYATSVFEQAIQIVRTSDADEDERRLQRARQVVEGLPGPRGERAVRSVQGREAIYRGPLIDAAADLFPSFEVEGVMMVPRVSSRQTWEPVRAPHGTHHPDGLLLGIGEGITPGGEIRADAQDVAPTILALLDVPVGGGMDGRPFPIVDAPTEALDVDLTRNLASAEGPMSSLEEEEIAERLRGLGYFD